VSGEPTKANERMGDPDIKNKKCRSDSWRDAAALMFCELATQICNLKTFNMCPAVRASTEEYMDSNNPVGAFLRRATERTDNPFDCVPSSDLYGQYCTLFRSSPLSTVKFAQGMEFNGIIKKRTKRGVVWTSLRLKGDDDPVPVDGDTPTS